MRVCVYKKRKKIQNEQTSKQTRCKQTIAMKDIIKTTEKEKTKIQV